MENEVTQNRKAYYKQWREKNPDKVKAYYKHYHEQNVSKVRLKNRMVKLKKNFNITIEQYDELEKRQKGVCAICGRKEISKRLAVDHCHKIGKIRGLLCKNCNTGLGLFNDNEKLLTKAIRYLSNKNI